jgi:hypothetical protein
MRLANPILFYAIATLALSLMSALQLSAQEAIPQNQADNLTESIRELQAQIRELRAVVEQLRQESMHDREEAVALRRELHATVPGQNSAIEISQNESDKRLSKVEENIQLLDSKVDEQHQTKIESASKYRMRLSGIVLFNLFSNRGTVNTIDNPSLAIDRSPIDSAGSFGGTIRQSIIGLEVFGPRVAGARTSADMQLDFAGGFSQTLNGVTLGLARLRTGVVRLEWPRTTIVAGQDGLFFAPTSPTSFASLSQPALSNAGNLWAWTPELRMEHRFDVSEESSITVQAGVLDGLAGEPPSSEYLRQPTAGEKSSQPAYAAHVGWLRTHSAQTIKLGTGIYYSRQNWGFSRRIDAWAALADWELPIGRLFQLSGEFHRGRAIGGLGGGIGQSVLFNGPLSSATTDVIGINTTGGWAQLKFKPLSKLEFNGAVGQDNPYAADITYLSSPQGYVNPRLVRNRGGLVNAILRPRSDLVFSLEYHRIQTFQVPKVSLTASDINLGAGVIF